MCRGYVNMSCERRCVEWVQICREYVSVLSGAIQPGGARHHRLPGFIVPGDGNKSRDLEMGVGR